MTRAATANFAGVSTTARSHTCSSNRCNGSGSSGRDDASRATSTAWRSEMRPSLNSRQTAGVRSSRVRACAARVRTVCSDRRRRTAISATAARSAMSARSRRTARMVRRRASLHEGSRVGSGPAHGVGSSAADCRMDAMSRYSSAVARWRSRATAFSRWRGASTSPSSASADRNSSNGSTAFCGAVSLDASRGTSDGAPAISAHSDAGESPTRSGMTTPFTAQGASSSASAHHSTSGTALSASDWCVG